MNTEQQPHSEAAGGPAAAKHGESPFKQLAHKIRELPRALPGQPAVPWRRKPKKKA